ncbi:hypothetical protein BgiMline_005154 [Biomphalaria glabrata]|uniref:Uncharacterized protein C2orf81 homolog isoform X1 n=1 Tax=Biomphalaria glabrata TaxID=6526 RepID=A0A9W2ZMZ7_BIOGL|nr:uncharacterized protein C2orf81 homolog isoform X1 [Biomphalaria glabrata]XP_055876328.1 uncharacterized protein C2orf81 homolog isoform X1 [Biomphalaria glabrata]XP_055876329.1 uncharacterized protein C2orf81 homolog isoform X1 [Biomphalaria glabrata]KAI8765557.1 hypothetical protein BgiMline_003227 [Biomphalaria glabrata]
MSRQATNRGRQAEKTTKPPTAVATPTSAHDIVPGKYNENDWNNMLEKDSGEEFCLDIVEELSEKVLSAIYDRYIENQLYPFTISQAKNALTEIIEWQFLSRDDGEKDTEMNLTWTQDEEPEPAVTDCWAQGSVPKNYIPPLTPLVGIPEEEPVVVEEISNTPLSAKVVKEDVIELPDFVSDNEEEAIKQEESSKETSTAVTKETKAKETQAKPKFRPYRGKLKSAKVGQMTESLEETEMKLHFSEVNIEPEKHRVSVIMPTSCASLLKAQNGRPPGNKEVTFDEMGNVVAVVKLDPEKLPNHKITVKYHVVDPALESKLEAVKKASSKVKTHSFKTNIETKVSSKSKHRLAATITPLPPPLKTQANSITSVKSSAENLVPVIEEMELSRGVIVKEGGRVKKGPGLFYRKLDLLEEGQKGLKQLNLRIANPEFSVNDLLDRATPILRPLGETPPLPPIVPQPPPQRTQYSV